MLNWLMPASQSDAPARRESMPPWVMSVMYLSLTARVDAGDDLLEIAPQRRLAAGEGDEHRIEEARRIGERLELGCFRAPDRSSSSRRSRSARCSAS